MVSLHELLEALLPLAHPMTCINTALAMCLGSDAFMCVSGTGPIWVRKSDLLCAPLAAAEDKKMS